MKKIFYALFLTFFVNTYSMDVILEENTTTESNYLKEIPADIAHKIMNYAMGAPGSSCLAFYHGITNQIAEHMAKETILKIALTAENWQAFLENFAKDFEKILIDTIGGKNSRAYENFAKTIEEVISSLKADLNGDVRLMRKWHFDQARLIKELYPLPEKSSFFIRLSPKVQRFLKNFCPIIYGRYRINYLSQKGADYIDSFSRKIYLENTPESMIDSSELSSSTENEETDFCSPISLPRELDKLTTQELNELKNYLKLRNLFLKELTRCATEQIATVQKQQRVLGHMSISLNVLIQLPWVYCGIRNYKETGSLVKTMINHCTLNPKNTLLWKYLGPRTYWASMALVVGWGIFSYAFNESNILFQKKLIPLEAILDVKVQEEAAELIARIQKKIDERNGAS